jgi:hypothetical protein
MCNFFYNPTHFSRKKEKEFLYSSRCEGSNTENPENMKKMDKFKKKMGEKIVRYLLPMLAKRLQIILSSSSENSPCLMLGLR